MLKPGPRIRSSILRLVEDLPLLHCRLLQLTRGCRQSHQKGSGRDGSILALDFLSLRSGKLMRKFRKWLQQANYH